MNDLNGVLIKYQPEEIYYSVSYFLSPENVGYDFYDGKREGYNISYNLFLGGDLIIDVDSEKETFENRIKESRNEVIKILKILNKLHFKEFKIVFTGNKGFRIDVEDFIFKPFFNLLPNENMFVYRMIKQNIANKILKMGGKFDYLTTIDHKRVVRLVGSKNKNTNLTVKIVPLEILKSLESQLFCYLLN